ncbi:type IV-A pilus assembly ATPase PilB [bacterium]|nr:type IV-A pilus assembly ATPase PilB [bacterium]MBU1637603.1 type IV-A pilus assembly ATPase PilB [bacterium]MBU1921126.1 type IV-A pilus assembly ATPase PilB [bacterium]
MSSRVANLLLNNNLISQEHFLVFKSRQKDSGNSVVTDLAKLGVVSEDQIASFLSTYYGIELIDLEKVEVPEQVLKLLSPDFVQKYQVLPLSRSGKTLRVALVDPSIDFVLEDVKFITGFNVQPAVVTETQFLRAIERYYHLGGTLDKILKDIGDDSGVEVISDRNDAELDKLKEEIDAAPIVKLVDGVIADAVHRGASDIHFEPYENQFRIRFRVDGVLSEAMSPPTHMKGAIVSRAKIMANLDIAERRVPQDGHIKMKFSDRTVDLRVSSLPTLYGEKIVMRILDKSNLTLDLATFGFEEKALADFEKAIRLPYGLLLVTGPTGSGKTTTLYSVLSRLNTPTVNSMTAEDPVEYNFAGLNQVQVREEVGLTFASALKAFLRQDPDIIMIGEIRDLETGSIAVRAALTGHLVLSTLHTNSAAATISRLIDMGLERFLVSSSLNLIVAQRLVRKICTKCKTPVEVHPEALREVGIDPDSVKGKTFYHGAGCLDCNNSGYRGRTGIYEVMPVTQKIREMILDSSNTYEIERAAIKEGMFNLNMSAIEKFKRGVTTIEEVLRVTGEA